MPVSGKHHQLLVINFLMKVSPAKTLVFCWRLKQVTCGFFIIAGSDSMYKLTGNFHWIHGVSGFCWMCVCTCRKVQWNFSFKGKQWEMKFWGDRALGMSWFPTKSVEGGESTRLPTSGLAQRSIFFFPPFHRKQNVSMYLSEQFLNRH